MPNLSCSDYTPITLGAAVEDAHYVRRWSSRELTEHCVSRKSPFIADDHWMILNIAVFMAECVCVCVFVGASKVFRELGLLQTSEP